MERSTQHRETLSWQRPNASLVAAHFTKAALNAEVLKDRIRCNLVVRAKRHSSPSATTHRVNPAYNTGNLSGNRSTLSTTR